MAPQLHADKFELYEAPGIYIIFPPVLFEEIFILNGTVQCCRKWDLKNKLYNLLKCFYSWVNEMTQWIRKLATKSEDLGPIAWKKRTGSYKFCWTCFMTCGTHISPCLHKLKKKGERIKSSFVSNVSVHVCVCVCALWILNVCVSVYLWA